MTAQELITLQPSQVRKSNELMAVYLKNYFLYLGRNPVCTSCTFDSDFRNFAVAVKNGEPKFNKLINPLIMETTFTILDPSSIYSYRKKGMAVKRCYGNNMNDEFAIAYLTIGTDEEIEKRKLEFKVLPAFFIDVKGFEKINTEIKKRGRKLTSK
jgi:hypothetical protein